MQSARRCILFIIDGLRPDALQQAYTPVIDRLIEQLASYWRQLVALEISTIPFAL